MDFAVLLALTTLFATHAPQDLPDKMKAVRMHAHGASEPLHVDVVPLPEPGEGELLVRVHAAGVNPVDWKIRESFGRSLYTTLPQTLGFDISGVVAKVGPKVEGFQVGDEVFAYLALARGGGYAEYAAIPQAEVAKKPRSIDHVHAAGVPLAALTAWQALFDTAGLEKGQTVLIHGGAGGVGHFAVQLAKARGARVIATGSANNQEFLKEIGADLAIDYRAHPFEEVAGQVDVVLDSVGGETQERSYKVLKPGGYLVSILQPPDPSRLKEAGVRGSVILVKPNGAELGEIATLIEAGKVKPVVSQTFALAEAEKAHESSKTGHTRGKLVLKVVE